MGLAAILCSCAKVEQTPQAEFSCPIGAYQQSDDIVIVYDRAPVPDARKPAYVFLDGRRGEFGSDEALLDCNASELTMVGGPAFKKVDIEERDVEFLSSGIALQGRLFSSSKDRTRGETLAVIVHGSERTGMLDRYYMPYMLAAQGVTVFAYDKRGTGRSGGAYTQNFDVLARDASKALETALEMRETLFDSVGFIGFSQGGWVAPLAATMTETDYLVVGYGLLMSPLEEDEEQVAQEMLELGYGEADRAKARRLAIAAGEVVANRFDAGVDDFLDIRAAYSEESWINLIEGEFTGDLLRASQEELRAGDVGDLKDAELMWRHDAYGVVRSLSIPQYWILAGEDREAPGQVTQQRLQQLQDEGKPVFFAVYPDTDHGIVQHTVSEGGARTYTGYPNGYFRLLADAAQQSLDESYDGAFVRFPGRGPD